MQTPPALERALRTALMPWGMQVARSQGRSRPTAPRSADQARVLARQLRADALVWISASPRRHELWLYDTASGAMTARGVPAPPFDETRAAALALSVKTELRKGTLAGPPPADAAAKTVTPVGKTDPATPGPTPAQVASELPEQAPPPADQPVDEAVEAPTEAPPPPPIEEIDRPPRFAVAPRLPYDAPHWRLLLHAAVRSGATSLDVSEGRYGVEGRFAPWASPSAVATLWLGARLDLGLPQTISSDVFRGDYSEFGAGLGVGVSMHLEHWLDLGLQVGANLYSASLSGTLLDNRIPVDSRQYGYMLHVRPEVELGLGTFGFVIQPSLGMAPARQRYKPEDDPREVLEMNAFWWQVGGAFRVNVD